MKFCIFILTLLCTPGLLHPSQQALTAHAKPTAKEVKSFWSAKYTADQIIFDLIEKYGEHIINEREVNDGGISEDPIILHAAYNFREWTATKFEKLLQTPGVVLNISSGSYTLLTAAMFNVSGGRMGIGDPCESQIKKITLLIKHGVGNNQKVPSGLTPLMRAAKKKQPRVTRLFLEAGASTDGYVIGELKTTNCDIGKTFFDYAKKNPEIQQIFEAYRKEITALISQRLGHINDLAQIVAAYTFTLSPIDHEEKIVSYEKF